MSLPPYAFTRSEIERLGKEWKKYKEIVEQLKKLNIISKLDEAYINCSRDHPRTREILTELKNKLQKILGEEK